MHLYGILSVLRTFLKRYGMPGMQLDLLELFPVPSRTKSEPLVNGHGSKNPSASLEAQC